MRHRAEEDALYQQFAKKRAEEETTISQEIQEEWEKELERLTSKFQYEMSMKKAKKFSSDEEKAITLRLQREKQDLEKNMTIKLDRKKESLTRKLLEQERQATADLVDKQSKEMISLINEKLFEYQQVTVFVIVLDHYLLMIPDYVHLMIAILNYLFKFAMVLCFARKLSGESFF